MRDITGLIGREPLVEKAAQEARKGRHVLLIGKVGVGKSAVLEAVLERLERRRVGFGRGAVGHMLLTWCFRPHLDAAAGSYKLPHGHRCR